jgi:hypothetical protein
MRKLGFLMLIIVSGCTTLGNWADGSMAWADRTMPTYDDWFGDDEPQQSGYTQRPPVPVPPVNSVETSRSQPPMSREQEIYYDNSERGHSFER